MFVGQVIVSVRDKQSATTFSEPFTYQISVVNSLINMSCRVRRGVSFALRFCQRNELTVYDLLAL